MSPIRPEYGTNILSRILEIFLIVLAMNSHNTAALTLSYHCPRYRLCHIHEADKCLY